MYISRFTKWIAKLITMNTFLLFPNDCQASTKHMYKYSQSKSTLPFDVVVCVNSYVSGLSHCASLASGSKTVTFFYNKEEHLCQWNCTFSFPETCSKMCTSPWTSYEVEWRTNAAFQKIPAVSSVYGDDYSLWGPRLATDGVFPTGDSQFFHTDFESYPWILIDLKEIVTISFIRVYNRGTLGHRFHDVAVEVSNNTAFNQRGFYRGPGLDLQVIEILCDHQTIAQNVRLRIIQGTGNWLNIPEIEIYTL